MLLLCNSPILSIFITSLEIKIKGDFPCCCISKHLLKYDVQPIRLILTLRSKNYATGCVSATLPPPSSISTGCLSKASNHWIVLPIKKHQLPQKVARLPSKTAPLLAAAKPRAPQSVKPMPCEKSVSVFNLYKEARTTNSDEIPNTDMPTKYFRSGKVPLLLSLYHKQRT